MSSWREHLAADREPVQPMWLITWLSCSATICVSDISHGRHSVAPRTLAHHPSEIHPFGRANADRSAGHGSASAASRIDFRALH